jgi:cell division ATPase FtsA
VGLLDVARRIFQAPVHQGLVQGVSGPANVLENPEFVAAIGLLRYGAMRARQRARPNILGKLKSLASFGSRSFLF